MPVFHSGNSMRLNATMKWWAFHHRQNGGAWYDRGTYAMGMVDGPRVGKRYTGGNALALCICLQEIYRLF